MLGRAGCDFVQLCSWPVLPSAMDTQTLIQKSPATQALLSRLSHVCKLYHSASHISKFPDTFSWTPWLPDSALSWRSVPDPPSASHHSVPFLSQGRLAVIFCYFILLFFFFFA